MAHDQFIFHVQVKVEKDRETDPVLATQSGVNEVQGHESESEPEPEVWVNLYTSLFAIVLHMPIFFIHCTNVFGYISQAKRAKKSTATKKNVKVCPRLTASPMIVSYNSYLSMYICLVHAQSIHIQCTG